MHSMAIENLPVFERPPVVEAVLGVFFAPPDDFDIVARGAFWSQYLADEFPVIQEQPPLEEVREEFSKERFSAPEVQIRWETNIPSPRIWARSMDGKHTIQLQRDAIVANWDRNPTEPNAYLHFADRKENFDRRIKQLNEFLGNRGSGGVAPTSCFVTYINHFELDDDNDIGSTMSRVLTFWKSETSDGWLPGVEQVNLNATFALPNESGRLHVTAGSAIRRRDRKPILRLELTARGTLNENTVEAASDWLMLGHEWVVRGFSSLTTPQMHKVWRRR